MKPYIVIVLTVVLTGGLVGTAMMLQHAQLHQRVDALTDRAGEQALRLDEIEDRVGAVDERFGQLESRVNDVEALAGNTDERLTRIADQVLPCCVAK